MALTCSRLSTPIGDLLLVDDDGVPVIAEFEGCEDRVAGHLRRHHGNARPSTGPVPPAVAGAFAAYFAGDPAALDALPAAPRGTDFQVRIWDALRRIAPGHTKTYGQVASEIGRPKAPRAVGHANGQNPLAILVPCHRLVGSDGTLTGYAGGLERKAWLLRHEAGGPGREFNRETL
ncbi:MAG: methylated-DNA--[protein]-cysteine S-methyltransferase [Alphaproteobacteria bacterium]